jgi:hypothetical protein
VTSAQVTGRLEQPLVGVLKEPPADAQMHLALRVIAEPHPARLGDPVVAEAVAGLTADYLSDPAAAGVDGLEQAEVEGRPESSSDHLGRLRRRSHGLSEVELAPDARQRAEDCGVDGSQVIDGPDEEFGDIGTDLDGRQGMQVPHRAPSGPERSESPFPLRPAQQLANLERVALGPVVELRGDVPKLGRGSADHGQQRPELPPREGLELDCGHIRRADAE